MCYDATLLVFDLESIWSRSLGIRVYWKGLFFYELWLTFSDSPENEIPMEIATAEPQVSEAVYDCVICGQSGPSSEDRPAGLVVLLQASSGEVKESF